MLTAVLLACRSPMPSTPAGSDSSAGFVAPNGSDSGPPAGDSTHDSVATDSADSGAGSDSASDTGIPQDGPVGPGGCPSWFPVDVVGTVWHYDFTDFQDTETAIGQSVWDGQEGWVVESVGTDLDVLVWYACDSSAVYQIGVNSPLIAGFEYAWEPPLDLLPASPREGDSWTQQVRFAQPPWNGDYGGPVTRGGSVGAPKRVTVAAGTFEVYPVTGNQEAPEVFETDYASGVGWVQRVGTDEPSDTLLSYSVPWS